MSARAERPQKAAWKRVVLAALITFLAFSAELDIPASEGSALRVFVLSLLGSFRGFHVSDALQLPGLVLLYWFLESKTGKPERKEWTVFVPSILFAFFMVFGYSFEKSGSWDLVLGIRNGQILKAALVFCGYVILFARVLHSLFSVLDRSVPSVPERLSPVRGGILGRFRRHVEEKPFRTLFLTLLIAYIPHILLSYPAIFMGDSRTQIVQAFRELKTTGIAYLTQDRLLSPSVFINQHHPVFHTWLLHLCLLLGEALFGSFSQGIFFCTLLQALGLIAAFSFTAAVLLRDRVIKPEHAILLIGYAILHPMIHNYICLITKDVVFAVFFVLLVCGCYLLLSGRRGGRIYACMAVACLGVMFFRNDWKYLLLPALLVTALLHRPSRKIFLLFACAALPVLFAVYGLLFPALRYTPGSVREMLSIPFQQTARYVLYHPDDVSEEERAAIDAVLDYDSLGKLYNPDKSDAVKGTYREEAGKKELLRYFRAWAAMLRRHPGTYVQATMNNYYQFFYPSTRFWIYNYQWSEQNMDDINDGIMSLGQSFYHPKQTEHFRYASDAVNISLLSFPGTSLLMTPAVYSWLLIAMLFYAFRRKKRAALAVLVHALGILLVCMTGPCNGYYGRYLFPLVALMPSLILMFTACCREDTA